MKKLYNDVPFSNKKKEESLVDLTTQVSTLSSSLAQSMTAKREGINIGQPPYNLSSGMDISTQFIDIWNEANLKNIPIIIPPGTFILNFTAPSDKVTIIGAGIGKTVLKAQNGSTKVFNISERKNIHVTGITFDGDKTTASIKAVAVECGGTQFSSFYECEFTNASDSGVHVTLSMDVYFTKCKFTNNGLNHPEANSGDGIITYNNRVDNLRVTECDFIGNWRNGISLDLLTGGSTVIDKCLFRNNTRGVHIEECSPSFSASIINCRAESNKGQAYGIGQNYGFFVGGNTAGWFFNVTLKQCSATDNNFGILMHNAKGVKIIDCDLYENSASGLSLGEARQNLIIGGSIINNYENGINSAYGVQQNIFQGVLIGDTRTESADKTQNYGVILHIYDDQNKFIGCLFTGNKTNYVLDEQDPGLFNKTEFINCITLA
jgi:hypothetical protein